MLRFSQHDSAFVCGNTPRCAPLSVLNGLTQRSRIWRIKRLSYLAPEDWKALSDQPRRRKGFMTGER